MDSSHTQTLRQLLVQIIDWIEDSGPLQWRTSHSPTQTLKQLVLKIIDSIRSADFFHSQENNGEINNPFSESDLVIVRDHALILDSRFFMEKKRSSVPDCYANLHLNEAWENRFQTPNFKLVNKWVVSFLQDLEEVFNVPNREDEDHPPWNVLVARFVDFLLQFLIGKPHLFAFDEPSRIINELQYFITIFLDSPFQATEDELVHTLLSQFETLANDAGRLVHSFLFSVHPPPFEKIDELLLEPINLLKANVINFLKSPSYVNSPNTLSCALSSVFIVDSLLYDLETLMKREDDSIVELKDHVEMLHRSLKHSWSLLKKHSNEADDVKIIVSQTFDAEYLINYFLCGDAPAWYLALRLPGIVHTVELVRNRLQEIRSENHEVDQVFEDADNFDARLSLQTGIHSRVDDTMVGFRDELLQILEQLVGAEQELQIISIVGMPGLGKTTLAKKLYDHPTVRDKFDRFSWCIVSQMYDRKKLLVDILTGLGSGSKKVTVEKMDDDGVGVLIHKTLKGRRYFIVVDDIWELSAWEDIKRYFPNDGNGSRILFTSRNKEVAQGNNTIHALPLLSNSQCWELLKKKVFHGESCPLELQHIGEKIAANCSGLPLVVIVVAGILSTMKKDLGAWENVRLTLDFNIMSYQDSAVKKSLELSYIYLPLHLKPCFLYFGRFQEDEQILVKKVMQFWIAEGLIPVDEERRAEDTAKEYLKELIDKSLVLVADTYYDGQAKVCIMHDLLHDMCSRIAEEYNFLKLVEGNYSMWNHNLQRVICKSSSSSSTIYCQPYGVRIRSFHDTRWRCNLNAHHMKVVRVLDAECSYLVRIPNLVHLRYLAVVQVPPIGRFSSLEFLIVHDTVDISSSLLDMMTKLRYLRAGKVYVSSHYNTSQTYNLEYLSKVYISQEKEDEQLLKLFPNLRKLRYKCQLEDYNCDFSSLTQLESLIFFGPSTICENKVPRNIIKLHLRQCVLSEEKMWIIGTLPYLEVFKLSQVRLEGGKWETRDNEFQKLKYLKLQWMKVLEWNVSSWEHFPVLQHLIIKSCKTLDKIPSEIGDIPTLQMISVSRCRRSLTESLRQIQEQFEEYGDEDNVKIIVKDEYDDDCGGDETLIHECRSDSSAFLFDAWRIYLPSMESLFSSHIESHRELLFTYGTSTNTTQPGSPLVQPRLSSSADVLTEIILSRGFLCFLAIFIVLILLN